MEWAKSNITLEPLKDNWGTLPKLRENGYQLGIISNYVKRWTEMLLAKDNFRSYFDYLIFSCYDSVRCAKPEAKIYQIALDLANEEAENCLFVDDKPANIEAAWNLGMKGFVYTQGKDDLEDLLREEGIRI